MAQNILVAHSVASETRYKLLPKLASLPRIRNPCRLSLVSLQILDGGTLPVMLVMSDTDHLVAFNPVYKGPKEGTPSRCLSRVRLELLRI